MINKLANWAVFELRNFDKINALIANRQLGMQLGFCRNLSERIEVSGPHCSANPGGLPVDRVHRIFQLDAITDCLEACAPYPGHYCCCKRDSAYGRRHDERFHTKFLITKPLAWASGAP
jgi:hypothetical protein